MRILIGTPIHEIKDYSMERWLKSVSKFKYPVDILLVDNSPGISYTKRVKQYCKNFGITNYELVHIDNDSGRMSLDERLAKSREVIRRKVLDQGYDAWFSLECDVIAPPDAPKKLVELLDDNLMVRHGYPARGSPGEMNDQFGISLIHRNALTDNSFLGGYGYCDPYSPTVWFEGDVWFIKRINRMSEGKNICVNGIIKPVYHLKS